MVSLISTISVISVISMFSDFSDFGYFNDVSEFGDSNDFSDVGKFNDFTNEAIWKAQMCLVKKTLSGPSHGTHGVRSGEKWSQPGELESWNPPNPEYDDSQNQNQHLGLTAFY